MSDSAGLAPGDLGLYDNYVPALTAGRYRIEVGHTLAHQVGNQMVPVITGKDGKADKEPVAGQSFHVSAPQFRIDPAAVLAVYPPDESSAEYGSDLPYLVLADPLLPFERVLPDPAQPKQRLPWLAVLVFRPGELTGGEGPTLTSSGTVAAFLAGGAKRVVPALTRAPDVADGDPCRFISVRGAVFKDIAPRLAELPFLAHCRRAASTDQPAGDPPAAAPGATPSPGQALVSVVVANRFPAKPAKAGEPIRHIAHLVSLEGLDHALGGAVADDDVVTLISLYSWAFWSRAKTGAPVAQAGGEHAPASSAPTDFQGLADAVIAPILAGKPADLLLRLPVPDAAGDPAGTEVKNRLADGYVPLEYRTPTGEATFAWYRGPLIPVPGSAAPCAFRTADAARAYDQRFGVFDLSLAAAWQAGRAAALADPMFGQQLLDFRRKAHALVDDLYQRLASDHFSATQVAEIDTSTTAQADFLSVLTAQLLADAGRGPQPTAPSLTAGPPGQPAKPDQDPQAALRAFLDQPQVQQRVLAAVREDLDPIAGWLARLLLLEYLPFACLVPDAAMLPAESVRFCYLDPGWQDAMLDGALSIGLESSLRVLYAALTRDLVRGAAYEAALVYRTGLMGLAVPPPRYPVAADPTVLTCLVLRSGLVTGWPHLAVRPRDANGALLPVLRMTRLSPSVLLCIFWGVPATVTLGEPSHGLRFGVGEDGNLKPRTPVAGGPGKPQLGEILPNTPPVHVIDPAGKLPLALRSAQTGVLNLDPQSHDSLTSQLGGALRTALPSGLGPADIALQLIKSPQELRFSVTRPAVPHA